MQKEKSMAEGGSFVGGYVSKVIRLKNRLLARLRHRPRPRPWTPPYRFEGSDISEDIRKKYQFNGDLLDFFSNNKGGTVHKWHHYIPVYDRYFSAFRNKPTRFLEIGVSRGGSLQMWRKYFGPDARICGIDIRPECIEFDGQAAMVRIGSQDDPEFLRSVVEELGGIDIVLDDGSHQMPHLKASLRILFPLLSEGGLYMIEDLHCAYMRDYGGGTRRRANFLNYVREIIDDMHRWYHLMPPRVPELDRILSGIHVHDSIVVLEKNRVYPPVHSKVGCRPARTAETGQKSLRQSQLGTQLYLPAVFGSPACHSLAAAGGAMSARSHSVRQLAEAGLVKCVVFLGKGAVTSIRMGT